MTERWDGLLLVDKSTGPTSHDIVAQGRRIAGQRKVGHAGTLDPPASGLLPLVFGRATRLVRFLPVSPKVYEGTFRLGLTTDTDDLSGETLTRHDGPLPSHDETLRAAATLLGSSQQVPPRVSARKIDGRRMYDLARRGVEFTPKATPIDVAAFDVTPSPTAGEYRYRLEVSGGTYVRGLIRDVGERLGCGAAVGDLRRTRIGPLRVEDAVALGDAGRDDRERLEQRLVPLSKMPLTVRPVHLAGPDPARRFLHGQLVPAIAEADDEIVGVFDESGELLGLGQASDGHVRPTVVLSDARPPT